LNLFIIFIKEFYLADHLKENKPYNDNTLFALIEAGNEKAFRQIFHEYNKKLYPFVFSMVKSDSDAKEIIQEVFLDLWLHRGNLSSIEKPGAWLHTITANSTYDFLHSKSRYALRLKKMPQPDESADIVMNELDARFTQSLINEAVERLPFKRRQVFRMARIDGMTRKEIARELNISENTVRNQLVRAMSSVQEYLFQKGALYLPAIILLLRDL